MTHLISKLFIAFMLLIISAVDQFMQISSVPDTIERKLKKSFK